MKTKRLFFLCLVAIALISCNVDDVITTELPPEIVFETDSRVFTTKVDRPLLIEPMYKYADDATYQWSVDGYSHYESVTNRPSFTFTASEVGSYYVTIHVTTTYGSDEEELRVDVVEREIPTISIANEGQHYNILPGYELTFTPSVRETSIPTTYKWMVNNVEVSNEINYTFSSDEIGEYTLTFTAENEDGSDSSTILVTVCTQDQMPFAWIFEKTEFNYAKGRSIRLMPTEVINGDGVVYTWSVNGETVQEGESSAWICDINTEGTYHVVVTATVEKAGSVIQLSQELVVNVCPAEGTYYRVATATSSPHWNKVYEYTPAPGQFINETATGGFDGSQTTAESAILYAEQRLSQNSWVSLGGFGGYIVVGFDHSIYNHDGYDFSIMSNTFAGSSEPGIVWVMQDDNGDGLPNDTWYELCGSSSQAAATIHDYAITYYRPGGAGMPVPWTDNQGNSGEIAYLANFHSQDYYYPLWIESDSYTLRGTCVEAFAYDKSGSGMYWVLTEHEWGYADNYSAIDCNREGDKANNFEIDNAIDYTGNRIHLDYIDFVRVHTAVHQQCGWIGENSTEVSGFYDNSLVNK